MKNAKKLAVVCLALAIMACSAVGVSAATYVANVVNADFASAATCEFLAPGDMNADGAVNATDVTALRTLLLSELGGGDYDVVFAANGIDAKYSDVNGDTTVDARDVVRLKKNMAESFQFISDGVMILNGNSSYKGDFLSVMGTGATYSVSYDYKSDAPVKVVISGLGDDIVFEDAAASSLTTVTHTLETPFSIETQDSIELKIIGVGTIDNFSVTRVNMDNELTENW